VCGINGVMNDTNAFFYLFLFFRFFDASDAFWTISWERNSRAGVVASVMEL